MTACFFEVCSYICLDMGRGGEEHPLSGKALPSMVKTHKELLLNTVKHMPDPFVALFQQRQDPSLPVTSIF